MIQINASTVEFTKMIIAAEGGTATIRDIKKPGETTVAKNRKCKEVAPGVFWCEKTKELFLSDQEITFKVVIENSIQLVNPGADDDKFDIEVEMNRIMSGKS